MKVYEITVHVASAYADIGELVISDELADAIGDFIATHSDDAVGGERDIAVQISPVEPKVIYDSDEKPKAGKMIKAYKDNAQNDLDFVRKTMAEVYCLRDGSVAASCSNAWEAVNKIKDKLGMIRKTDDKDLNESEASRD